jgi:hypothetical protein
MTMGLKANADGSGAIQVGGSDAITITSGLAATFPSNVSVTGNVSLTGNASLTGATSTLGYGTGSGGTVTQLTNKSTAVTLNKAAGQITTNNAALVASATASFVVNNTTISTGDVVIVAINNNANYTAIANYTTSGSFGIRLTNVSGGSLSDAVVLNFAVIKGATS